MPKSITGSIDLQHIKNTIKTYTKVLPICQIVNDPESEEGKQLIAAFVAGYAKLRDWPSNKDHRKAVSEALEPFLKTETIDETEEVKNLLKERKYIVLQGPPGTGKTRTAKKCCRQNKCKNILHSISRRNKFLRFYFWNSTRYRKSRTAIQRKFG